MTCHCYRYELWNGKKVVGHLNLLHPIFGKELVIPFMKQKDIHLPIGYRIIKQNYKDTHLRKVLMAKGLSEAKLRLLSKS